MIRVIKKDNESTDKLYNRFNKKVQASHLLNEVKERKHFSSKKSKRKVRAAAVMREYYRAKRKKERFYV